MVEIEQPKRQRQDKQSTSTLFDRELMQPLFQPGGEKQQYQIGQPGHKAVLDDIAFSRRDAFQNGRLRKMIGQAKQDQAGSR